MLRAKQTLKGRISSRGSIKGKLNNATRYIYPELENLEVTPNTEEQHFKSDKYGYGEITVKAIESEELSITPTAEEQVKEGVFSKVTVEGEPNLVPENIKKDTEIFGITGIAELKGEENAVVNGSVVATNTTTNTNTALLNKMIKKLPPIDTSGWISTAYLFYNCESLEEIPQIDTSNVTNMYNMFYNCKSIKNIPELDTSKVTSMAYMFYNCKEIEEINNLNTSNVTSLTYIFSNCTKLKKVSNLDTLKATNLSAMFFACESLMEIPELNTSNVTNMQNMFRSCNAITTIPKLDASKVDNVNQMFGCKSLTNLGGLVNLGKGYTRKATNNMYQVLDFIFGSSPAPLTYESLINLLTNLYDLNLTYDVANGGTLYTQSIAIGAKNINKLEATEEGQAALAQAALYGWTIS